ncbi:hypothetical protein GCM10023149_52060 [Mucilaginibacter gynuensis]|uniref:Uncharacterized protein n=1 Tax=Mucilaginibacter gynuensis TaxID=1302236 RepID=A0ABP8HKL5_9SPHI
MNTHIPNTTFIQYEMYTTLLLLLPNKCKSKKGADVKAMPKNDSIIFLKIIFDDIPSKNLTAQ